ncbi:MAG: 2-hydroxychromene-2-carboxylate isomerase [Myxococcota bacterium]
MARTLEFYFDYLSPYSYLANSQMPALAERTGAEIVYRPVLNGGIVTASENKAPPMVPAKLRYMGVDVPRWVKRFGVPFAPPGGLMNTLRALRGAVALQLDGGDFPAYHEALFRGAFADGRDLSDVANVLDLAAKAGIDAEKLAARMEEPEVKEKLKADTAAAVERGLFGVPTFFVDDEMFFGVDHLDFVEEALNAS